MSTANERELPVGNEDDVVADELAMTTAINMAETHESADFEDWAIVDDQAEIVGLESRSATRDASPVTTSPVDTRTDTASADVTADQNDDDAHAHEPQQEQPNERTSVDSITATEVELPSERDDNIDTVPAAADPSVASADASASAPTTASAALTASSNTTSVAVPDGCMRVRIREGEHVRPAWCKATQLVDDFVAEFFVDAVAQGKRVRLIFMGMLLLRERTMGEYGIDEDGVIHCVITEAPQVPQPHAAQSPVLKGLSNPANSLLVLTGVVLYGLWTLLYHFPHVFSWKSIVLLSLFSAAHVSATVARFSA